LVFCEDNAVNTTLLNAVFENPSPTVSISSGTGAGSIYRYSNNPVDPIMKGPFGNISGLTWGEDATPTLFATNVPLSEVTLYSSNQNISAATASAAVEYSATAFRHNTYPFVWCGDGGFNSNNDGTSATICPFKLTSKTINGHNYPNYPTYKPDYGLSSSYRFNVYNAVFTANAMGWCITRAEELKRAQKQK
jgi:hypothetical protein